MELRHLRSRSTPLQRGASPHQSLDGESDDSGEQEEGRDQDVEERQGGEGLGGVRDGFLEDLMGHKRLEGRKMLKARKCTGMMQL